MIKRYSDVGLARARVIYQCTLRRVCSQISVAQSPSHRSGHSESTTQKQLGPSTLLWDVDLQLQRRNMLPGPIVITEVSHVPQHGSNNKRLNRIKISWAHPFIGMGRSVG